MLSSKPFTYHIYFTAADFGLTGLKLNKGKELYLLSDFTVSINKLYIVKRSFSKPCVHENITGLTPNTNAMRSP